MTGTPAVAEVVASFRETVCDQIALRPAGDGRYVVSNPFIHDDGDCLEIVLRRDGEGWVLTDEGCTFMRLSFDIEGAVILQGARQQAISNALRVFGVKDRDGELALPVEGERFGDALFAFVQTVLRIGNIAELAGEPHGSTPGAVRRRMPQ